MKITIKHYPIKGTLEFEIDETRLPPVSTKEEGYCNVRTLIAQAAISTYGHDTHHGIEDFVVEYVKKTKTGETWEIAS